MRVPAPVSGAVYEARYRENHQGLPFFMTTYMALVREAAFMLLMVVTLPLPFAWVVLIFLHGFPWSRYDIFAVVGFKLFHRLLGQFPWSE